MWFEVLTGFAEESPEQVRENIIVDRGELVSLVNNRRLICGELETPSLAELRRLAQSSTRNAHKTTVRELVADVQGLHRDEHNADAIFQVASQFNLLEMVSPSITPECGVGIYENDHTQGPACAIAAGAGTIYRNYFANVNAKTGQSATNQIDCLSDLGLALGNSDGRLWTIGRCQDSCRLKCSVVHAAPSAAAVRDGFRHTVSTLDQFLVLPDQRRGFFRCARS